MRFAISRANGSMFERMDTPGPRFRQEAPALALLGPLLRSSGGSGISGEDDTTGTLHGCGLSG
jgi:hypothetical protein